MIEICRRMSLFNQMKLGVAKVIEFSTDGNIFEIPECPALMTTDKVSIKVANDTQMYLFSNTDLIHFCHSLKFHRKS